MKVLKFDSVLCTSLAGICFFCFASVANAENIIQVSKESSVKNLTSLETVKNIKPEEPWTVEIKEPLLVQSPGSVPIILVPVKGAASKIELNAPKVEDWPSSTVSEKINSVLGELIGEVYQIRTLLKNKNSKSALQKLNQLQGKYPEVAYLNFLRASALFLEGQKAEAKTALEAALRVYPNNPEGLELKKVLGGQNL